MAGAKRHYGSVDGYPGEGCEAYQLREPQVSYPDVFATKNDDIDAKNSYS